MGILTADIKRVVGEQRLGFVATVCPDVTPNLSPKCTTAVWDDDHLVFANIRSPDTLVNRRKNANVGVNVLDPFVRRGYRFIGVASILESGASYDKVLAYYRGRRARSIVREIVMIRVQTAQPIDSPAHDLGLTEDQIRDWGSGTSSHFELKGQRHRQASNKERDCLTRPCRPTPICPATPEPTFPVIAFTKDLFRLLAFNSAPSPLLQLFTIICDCLTHSPRRVFIVSLSFGE